MALENYKFCNKLFSIALILLSVIFIFGCGRTYRVTPMSFRTPAAYPNSREVAGTVVGGTAYVDYQEAGEAFGFRIREAGILPVQLVFDNQGEKSLQINSSQTFLEDEKGNLWPVLSRDMAYNRVSKYAETKQIFSEGAKAGLLSSAAGAVIGAAVGVVTGENVASSAGKGAAVGAAAGATAGGVKGYTSGDARREIMTDLRQKGLEQKNIEPGGLSYGFLFFPGESETAAKLRLQLIERDKDTVYNLTLDF